MQVETLDLRFQDTRQVIASFLLHGPTGPVLIETGPATTLPVLLEQLSQRGLRPADVRHVLVTHIHLDHAGAAGWWARQGATVYVHPVGAPHLIDPDKLLRSAKRIYGERMGSLWGEVLPAPADRVAAVDDGDVVRACGLEIEAIATPGHAYHHHVFRVGDLVFTGDAAGIRLPASEWIDLPAPPPEFDLVAWRTSLRRLVGLGRCTFYRTHFGGVAVDDAAAELEIFGRVMEQAVEAVREMLAQELNREAMIGRFAELMRERAVEHGLDESRLRAYELANPRMMSVDGITRYWRKFTGSPSRPVDG